MRDQVIGLLIAIAIAVLGGGAGYLWMRATADPVETGPTGAEAGSDLDRFLRQQGFKLEDLQANREGRLSPRQIERMSRHTRRWRSAVLGTFAVLLLVLAAVALRNYVKNHRAAIFILPASAIIMGAIVYGIWSAMFSPPDKELAAGKVTLVSGPIESFRPWSILERYYVTLHGTTYMSLGAYEMSQKRNLRDGLEVKAYVLPESKKLVALEPM